MQRLGDLLGLHVLEHLVAHGFVELWQRRGLEVLAERGDEAGALLGTKKLDQVGKIGGVEIERERPRP